MNRFYIKSSAALCAAISLSNLHAASSHEVYELQDFVVSAGPLARPVEDYVTPFTALDRDAIQRENGGTLGQLLDGQTGITATSFGGGASRPIIRGFDGPRVRILESGLGSSDVSETSPDHAVSVEPLLSERVEILRGPSTLLYGSSAIGGVVNTIGKELPRTPVIAPKGYEGAIETRYDSVSNAETYLGYGTVGNENWAFSLTGLTRDAENYEIPSEAEIHHDDDDDDDEAGHGNKLENSFVQNDFVSVGGSWFFGEQNYIGAAFSVYDAFYGVPGHAHHEDDEDDEGVAIDLERKRFDMELALFDVSDWIEAARVRFGYTDYEHTELEGDEQGTTFERNGWELRAEAAHNEWAFIDQGILGINLGSTDFEAIGEEGAAFGPPTNTNTQALFFSEHKHHGNWHYEFGGRVEAQQIDADNAANYNDVALSVAFGLIYYVDDENALALSLQRSQRHPSAGELYAGGAHLATRQYELGDADLDLETAYGVDLSYRHNSDLWTANVSLFYTHFEDYIYAANLGYQTDDEGRTSIGGDPDFEEDHALDTYQYSAVEAAFWGIEADIERQLINRNDLQVAVGLLGDYVRGETRDATQDLPRIPPLRLGGKVRLAYGNWDAGLLLRHAFEQSDTAPLETETDSYTELKIDLSYTFDLGNDLDLTLFARADNLLDEEIRHHTSFLKDLAPLPGRNFTLGARLAF
jgi:iron complex outermembrane receptor protein